MAKPNPEAEVRHATLEDLLSAERAKTAALTELLETARSGGTAFLLGRADAIIHLLTEGFAKAAPGQGAVMLEHARALREDVFAFMKRPAS